jgi:peptide/nickel transport system substrate-binding protein
MKDRVLGQCRTVSWTPCRLRQCGRWRWAAALLLVLSSSGCRERSTQCPTCDAVVVAAMGEPATLFPPFVEQTVGRDISDLVFERLADLAPSAAPIDTAGYRPRLASRWERLDSLTWRFHLRPGARWHDGQPVTAEDVRFSFEAYGDSTIGATGWPAGTGRIRVIVEDPNTFRLRFAEPSSEQLFDATYRVRVIPKHVWASIPTSRWRADSSLTHLVGSGPFRVREWRRGQHLILEATSSGLRSPVRRVVWRFTEDADAAVNLLLSHEADLVETVGVPDRTRVGADTSFRLTPYPGAVYGYVGFRLADSMGRPHPVLGDRQVRRALAEAVNRPELAAALFGAGTRIPPGPMSQLLWIWDAGIRTVPFDTASAARVLRASHGPGHRVRFDVLVPATSSIRRHAALALQEAWRRVGVEATITTVDFPIFQERLRQGRFDAYIGAYLDEPSPRGLAEQWSRAGWADLNYGHYGNPVFDSLLHAAQKDGDVAVAKRHWREAMDTLNADVPAIFLYAPSNVAAVHQRLTGFVVDPYSWLSGLQASRIDDRIAR